MYFKPWHYTGVNGQPCGLATLSHGESATGSLDRKLSGPPQAVWTWQKVMKLRNISATPSPKYG